ncbi:MAG: hypothetical protein K0Q53_2778 [Massilibacillus sp.]|jgi:hypothetical protein|nr:hypothetical protein [Massilibacillus sp.]
MTLDHGGKEEVVSLKQITGGMSFFTLLDAVQPTGTGLVKLSNLPIDFLPAKGEPIETTFVDNESKGSSRLFGQGAELICNEYAVTYE